MKEYPDAHRFFKQHVEQEVDKHMSQYDQAQGWTPNQKQIDMLVTRTFEESKELYEEECSEVLLHNLEVLKQEYEPMMRAERRQRIWVGSISTLVFSILACYSFLQQPTILGVMIGCFCMLMAVSLLLIVLNDSTKDGSS